ncbi:MAG: filamentation induced by cAMP protein Fic [Caulobacteraceae bacterium]|nr:filamentation induced by cAMP protein Fic [Caulobacteraceae bacterium]
MRWNWQQPGWPEFLWDPKALEPLEASFLLQSGEFVGVFRHVSLEDQTALRIELISDEAVKTSAIEGQILNRDSVQSSLRHQFGLGVEQANVSAGERGVAQMMVDLYREYATALSDRTLFGWHSLLLAGDTSIKTVGGYRVDDDPMQVVSGPIQKRKIHFEAPPSAAMPAEMQGFIQWFNDTAPQGSKPLPALTRAGIGHLYFVSIHPFEDGNGRIGRALGEKSLAQNLGHPSLIALAYTIERTRKEYYAALERNNQGIEITDWLVYFAKTILQAQVITIKRVDFYVAKARFYERLRGQLNNRQAKVIARVLKEGLDGFKGGLSAENYITIAETSRATATRDLQDLVEKQAFSRTGERRHARYHPAL